MSSACFGILKAIFFYNCLSCFAFSFIALRGTASALEKKG